ncbi:hypothetical protein V6N13_015427 [Hibiscus sabdariffa]|uniref:Uncharacterized protein n=2 Tax=Hibiscus sabdariffa TaxID=183260 RepID=A0ABR2CVM6_9ROSI
MRATLQHQQMVEDLRTMKDTQFMAIAAGNFSSMSKHCSLQIANAMQIFPCDCPWKLNYMKLGQFAALEFVNL